MSVSLEGARSLTQAATGLRDVVGRLEAARGEVAGPSDIHKFKTWHWHAVNLLRGIELRLERIEVEIGRGMLADEAGLTDAGREMLA